MPDPAPESRSTTQLELRLDHAAARDAVQREIDPLRDFGAEFITARQLVMVSTRASCKQEYLLRPDLGRSLSEEGRDAIAETGQIGVDLQIVIGDGLSAAAVAAQVPLLLPLLETGAKARGWTLGSSVLVRYCRVGVVNELGDLLAPRVLVLLIGERPGLATAVGLSAYLAWRPVSVASTAYRIWWGEGALAGT